MRQITWLSTKYAEPGRHRCLKGSPRRGTDQYVTEVGWAKVATREDALLVGDELKDENAFLRQDLMTFREELKVGVTTLREELRANVAALSQEVMALDTSVGQLEVKIEMLRTDLLQQITTTRWYVVTATVIIVLAHLKVVDVLDKVTMLLAQVDPLVNARRRSPPV